MICRRRIINKRQYGSSSGIMMFAFAWFAFILTNAPIIADTSDTESQLENRNKPVARVGDILITADEFLNSYEFGPAFVKRVPDSKKKYLDYMINEKLLALEGYSEGLDTTDEAREFHHAILSDLTTEELFKDDILNKIEVAQPEIDSVVNMKKVQLDISWLFSADVNGINKYWELLKEGVSFDSLLNSQLSDTVFRDMRTMKIDRYQLGKKNPLLAGIIDTLKAGSYTLPIHTEDGWYIVKLKNIWRDMITPESETGKLIYEAREAVIKQKMDAASDKYVDKLMRSVSPIIKGDAFKILRSYVAQYVIPEEKINEWDLKEKMDETLRKYNDLQSYQFNELPLVEYTDGSASLAEFLTWYRTRSQYIKFNKTDLASYSRSLEQLVWRMLRDKLLFEVAKDRGYTKFESVVAQSKWWKDKICFSSKLNQLQNSIELNNDEVADSERADESESEMQKIEQELSVKLFREVQKLRKKYDVEIYNDALNKIHVSDENDPRAIDLYTVKKGGLIPRTPYPSIDMIWKLWE